MRRPFETRADRGFILIAVLVMSGLLLTLLLGLTVYVRLEIRALFHRHQHEAAKQNALFGMRVALAALQHHAGPDQRATGRPYLLPTDGNNPFWTGVWDLSGNDEPELLTWLVSGNESSFLAHTPDDPVLPDRNAALFSDEGYIRLVSPLMAGAAGGVIVPRIPVTIPGDEYPGWNPLDGDPVTGGYAYWVGDEGVKAHVSLTSREDGIHYYDETQANTWRQLAAHRPASEVVFTHPSFDPDGDTKEPLRQVLKYDQIQLLAGIGPATARNHFHAATVVSHGVMEDPKEGGLKINLSDPAYRDGTITDEVAAFLSNRSVTSALPVIWPNVSGTLEHGTALHQVAPVLTEAAVYCALEYDDATEEIHARLWFRGELWNPYTFPLRFEAGTEGDEQIGSLHVTGLPHITVTNLTRKEAGLEDAVVSWEMDAFPGEPPGHNHVHGPVTVTDLLLAPGEVYEFREPMPEGERWLRRTGLRLAADPGDDLLVEATYGGSVAFSLVVDEGGRPVREVRGMRFGDFTIEGIRREDLGDVPSLPTLFVHHFRFRDDPATMAVWAGTIDPRTPVLDLEAPEKANVVSANAVAFPFDGEAFSATDLFYGAGPHIHSEENADLRWYDVPAQEPVSVGVLRHLYRHHVPPLLLGEAVPSSMHNVFDRYFFSGSPPPDWHVESGIPLPNPRLVPIRSHGMLFDPGLPGSYDAAKGFLVRGMFNVQSTDYDAWRVVLSNRIPGWKHSGASTDLVNAWFRHPFGASRLSSLETELSVLENPEHAYRQGIRTVGEQNAINQLARLLTDGIRERGKPFFSVKGFVESGVLQESIDAVPSLNGEIPPGAPARLTQGDLLAALAPYLSVRSDTFRIRAYGESRNPYTGQVGARAWCEAIVQRMPEPMENSEPMDKVKAPGRRFRIVSFQWLDASEI